jgi:UDP-N-acetylglucosamine 2-epimerase (non-hydrolysing)
MKIINVVGARPNFIKIAPIMRALAPYKSIKQILVHTDQHYDWNMSSTFFKDLSIPRPDIYLKVGSCERKAQIRRIKERFENTIKREKPDLVIVVGDVNSTLACALAAHKCGVKIAHVEAGLRSFDMSMPEEINRIRTDKISDLLFTSCMDAGKNLAREGIAKKKVFFVGNVMIDSLMLSMKKLPRHGLVSGADKLPSETYAVVTIHRPSNVDHKKTLTNISKTLNKLSGKIRLVFPAHPRTKKQISRFGLEKYYTNNIRLIPPVGYLDFLSLYSGAEFVLTDSGGIQEETTALNIPCLTMRKNTERPITITCGTNVLVGTDSDKITAEVYKILRGEGKKAKKIKFWDGRTSERIAKIIFEKCCAPVI